MLGGGNKGVSLAILVKRFAMALGIFSAPRYGAPELAVEARPH